MGNININGKSAVHAGSEGKLITSDVCLTPPFCVPIAYTNQAESKMTDQGASSVKIAGNPACNNKSTFKISTGDAPGACAGASSGSIGQMAEFITSSQDVMIEGKPAVRNGDKMVSNMRNTAPQPLMQPPVGNPPAGTAKAPAAVENEFSQQFDFAKVIGFVPGTQTLLQKPSYEIWDKNGTLLLDGALNDQGLTQRFYTQEKQEVIVWLGEGGWKILAECEHDASDDPADNSSINCICHDFAGQPIEGLGYKLIANGITTSGKTDATGSTQVLSDLKTGTLVDVLVLREGTQDYKKIGTLYAYPGETIYSIISPKIKVESVTDKHMDKSGAAASAPPASSGTAKKPEIKHVRNDKNNPQAIVSTVDWLINNVLGVFQHWTWSDFKNTEVTTFNSKGAASVNHATQGHPKLKPATLPSPVPLGSPLSKENLKRLNDLIDFAEKQVVLDYTECKAHKSNKISSSQAVINKYEKEGKTPDFGKEKKSDKPNRMCLAYVKVALFQKDYINGIPDTGPAKDSGADWVQAKYGFKEVTTLPTVEITYKHTTVPQPDLIYTLPGDVIVYEQVDPTDASAAGHIDIRTYHNFVSDFARAHPLPALGAGSGAHFKVTGVYRKISDTMAMARVQAFLRIIREQVAGETSLADKERSYHLLTYNKDAKEPFAEGNRNGDLSKAHPSDIKKNKPAGAYQIIYSDWQMATDGTGWPKTFTREMQDRIAMYLLQEHPLKTMPHPRRSALGYIMEGKIEEAMDIIKQEPKLTYWHEIANQNFDMAALNAVFDKYTKEASK